MGNLDPIERQDLGRGQHIRAIFLVLRIYRLTPDDVEHESVLMVAAALFQGCGGRLSRGVQLRDRCSSDEMSVLPDLMSMMSTVVRGCVG